MDLSQVRWQAKGISQSFIIIISYIVYTLLLLYTKLKLPSTFSSFLCRTSLKCWVNHSRTLGTHDIIK